MSTEVTLPALGESVTEGTVSRWLKEVGETVEADEPLLEVSTDKVDTEIPSPAAGVLKEIKVPEDEVAEVGQVLAIIGDADDEDSSDQGSSESDQQASGDESGSDADDSGSASDDSGSESSDSESSDDQQQAPASTDQESSGTQSSNGSAGGQGTEVTLPALGESVTEGTVSRWLKEVGEEVEADEPLLEVSTDKVDTEVPAPVAGTLLEIKVAEDEVAEVGAVLAIIGDADAAGGSDDAGEDSQQDQAAPEETGGEQQDEPETEQPKAEPAEEVEPEPEQEPASQPASASDGQGDSGEKGDSPRRADINDEGIYVTPLVRKLAKEHSVDLSTLEGTGVGGRIRKQDVLAAAEAAQQAEEPKQEAPAASQPAPSAAAAPSAEAESKRGTTEKMTRIRSTIAKRMVESLQTSAQLTATVEVDFTNISRLRARAKDDFKKREGASLSYLPFITKAVVEALKQFPKVNATIDTEAGTITYSDAEHIGLAVDTERGLMVPVIKDTGDLSLAGIARKIGDLAGRARSGKIGPDELSGGTFTITNYGSAGTLFDTPIINQPQVAILGTGALVKRPMVLTDDYGSDTIAVRDMMYLSMSYDHRLVDGADAARFLSAVKARLEEGNFGGELGL